MGGIMYQGLNDRCVSTKLMMRTVWVSMQIVHIHKI